MGIWDKKFRSDNNAKSPNSNSDGPRGRSVLTLSNAVPQISNAVKDHKKIKSVTLGDNNNKTQINRTFNYFRKLAVDCAVNDSLKGVAGGVLMDKIAKEGPINKNNKLGLEVAEVLHAGIEKMQENVNCDDPQTMIFSQNIRLLDCFDDLPKEPIKGSNSSKTAPRRIMIRSRL